MVDAMRMDRGEQLLLLRRCVFPDVSLGEVTVGSGVLKSVLRCIDDHIDYSKPISKQWCWPSVETIAKECGWSEATTHRALRALKELGALSVDSRGGRTSLRQVNWTFIATLPTVQDDSNPCHSDTPVTVIPLSPRLDTPVTVIGDPCHSDTRNEKETKRKRKESLTFTPEDRKTAEWFWERVRQSTGTDSKPPDFDRWADSIRKIREDGQTPRTDADIRAAITAAHADNFWSKNILSPDKLRQKWTQISALRKGSAVADPSHRPWRSGSEH